MSWFRIAGGDACRRALQHALGHRRFPVLLVLAAFALVPLVRGETAHALISAQQADVNRDGKSNVIDLVLASQGHPNADVNADSHVNALDLAAIAAYIRSLAPPPPAATRDKLRQPFASTSIWNMPVGSAAAYQPANIKDWTGWGVFLEEIYIIHRPTAPLQPIYWSDDRWSGGSRCEPTSTQIQYYAPVPDNFVIAGATSGDTPNNPSGILTADGNSYLQSQPLTHCPGHPYTTGFQGPTVSLYGDGRAGSQGGSHLSAVGGTIRRGEFGAGKIPHALKTVLHPSNLSSTAGPDCGAPGCRWPATASDCGSTACGYSGTNPGLKMGSLLALPPTYNCTVMRTAPGRIVCEALRDYGMYVVDTGWGPAYLPVERGPDGTVEAEFQSLYGYPMKQSSMSHPWSQDWKQLVLALQIIDNNRPAAIGGGGTPRQPLAPPIGN
jgi:hypothetical protein